MTWLTLHMPIVFRTWHDWHCQRPSTSTAFVQANCSWNHGRHNTTWLQCHLTHDCHLHWWHDCHCHWLPQQPLFRHIVDESTADTTHDMAHSFFLITSTAWVQANCQWQYSWCNTWHEWHCQWHGWHCHQPPLQLSFSHTDDESTADTTHDMNGTANDDVTGTATDHPHSPCEGEHLATGVRLTLSLGYSTREMFSARFRSHTAVM